MSTTNDNNDDLCVDSEEMKSSKKEYTSCEQNNVNNITEGIESVAILDNITTCANCGKEGDSNDMNMCNKCKSVKYCNAACKKKHRKKHKKSCEKRMAELHEEALFKEVEPDECPICLLTLPLDTGNAQFQTCCGKVICHGCICAMKMSEGKDLCAFCRTPPPSSDEDRVKRVEKLIDNGNAKAYCNYGNYYYNGRMGMQQNQIKACELWLKAAELGCCEGYFNLGIAYDQGRGVEVDKKKASHYFELSAMGGDMKARHNLGCTEYKAGNHYRAMKHLMIAARSGTKESLDCVKIGFTNGYITKDEYASTLRAYQKRLDEMKSGERDKAALLIATA